MKVFTHNFDPTSESGPNKFSRQLLTNLVENKGFNLTDQKSADVEFCLIQQTAQKIKPMLLRLDGIYFNKTQDYHKQNHPIAFSYRNADAVVFQSNFNKLLTEHWFGKHHNSYVIHNAYLDNLVKNNFFQEDSSREIWSCASSWRPHKRLLQNVRYFLENAPENAVLYVAGGGITEDDVKNIQLMSRSHHYNKQIKICGNLDYLRLRMLYDLSTTFIHLAYLDHCPNVVVDAVAHECHVVCSSTGGTKEVVKKGTIIVEDDWDFSPINLYEPPDMDFSRKLLVDEYLDNSENSKKCLENYEKALRNML